MSGVATLLVLVFFALSGDSAKPVLGMMSTGGNHGPLAQVKVTWGLLVSGIAIGLLLAGGIQAVQTAPIVLAMSFTLGALLMIAMLWRCVHADWTAHERHERVLRRRLENLSVKSHVKLPVQP